MSQDNSSYEETSQNSSDQSDSSDNQFFNFDFEEVSENNPKILEIHSDIGVVIKRQQHSGLDFEFQVKEDVIHINSEYIKRKSEQSLSLNLFARPSYLFVDDLIWS
ncbi:Hypothetical_protein [Hexamita inflata]|uniref:Hypothetical_protein n=1 Tax=Hexamita inflata TaxID=28002 RepID=A0AA86U8J7_9EUKA|nr:Hypothetical protein HINF_LOCUS30766 [Hexamita inflata]